MKMGTESLLFGVHQFIWHPITVTLAWIELYHKAPTLKEFVCIVIHDWGYFGCPDMDGEKGRRHPYLGARIAMAFLDNMGEGEYHNLCLLHSREVANMFGVKPSKLCWADKLSVKYDPWFLYLPRAILSGEIKEYRKSASDFGAVPLSASHYTWFKWGRDHMMKKALDRDARPSYTEGTQ